MAKTKKAAGDPCWDGYEKVGMKMKKGKLVPNCVPIKKGATKKSNNKKAAGKKSTNKKAATKKAATKKSSAKAVSKKAATPGKKAASK